jgi:hypothetical protein
MISPSMNRCRSMAKAGSGPIHDDDDMDIEYGWHRIPNYQISSGLSSCWRVITHQHHQSPWLTESCSSPNHWILLHIHHIQGVIFSKMSVRCAMAQWKDWHLAVSPRRSQVQIPVWRVQHVIEVGHVDQGASLRGAVYWHFHIKRTVCCPLVSETCHSWDMSL